MNSLNDRMTLNKTVKLSSSNVQSFFSHRGRVASSVHVTREFSDDRIVPAEQKTKILTSHWYCSLSKMSKGLTELESGRGNFRHFFT